ncbi:hypothetical protein [Bdellovibrio sp. HCB337]|uniref:hypothetical protein n=1 Tax=Bdellovibrio sp. HCB337 TaxID=3394358 RepID=UPI0039A7332F
MKKASLVLSIFAGVLAGFFVKAETASPSAIYYQQRYPLKNVNDKLVDNHGNGYENLYGVRNFRAVLNGVVYRGGANNDYNKYGKRDNNNPLPRVGLENLCEEGFETAVYLYSKNYEKAPKTVACKNIFDQTQKLDYVQKSPHLYDKDVRAILSIIHQRLQDETDKRPIYLHCWNGWHASGLISAMVLRQFCDYSSDQAVKYWDRNTDGVNKKVRHDRFRQKVRAFKPDPNMKIDDDVKARVCPRS